MKSSAEPAWTLAQPIASASDSTVDASREIGEIGEIDAAEATRGRDKHVLPDADRFEERGTRTESGKARQAGNGFISSGSPRGMLARRIRGGGRSGRRVGRDGRVVGLEGDRRMRGHASIIRIEPRRNAGDCLGASRSCDIESEVFRCCPSLHRRRSIAPPQWKSRLRVTSPCSNGV